MSETVIVDALKDARDWESDDGKIKNTYYTLDVKKADGAVEEVDLGRKQGAPEPQPGEELEVVFEPGKFRRKIKLAPHQFGGSQPRKFDSTKATKGWQPEQERDPERSARILRQHSQTTALEYAYAVKLFEGLNPEALGHDPRAKVPQSFWRLVDEFDQDVIQAGQAAREGQSPTVSGTVGASSADARTAPPSAPADISRQECMEALDTAGLIEIAPAEKVADYMLSELPPDRFNKAINNLTYAGDTQMQGKTLSALKTATVTHFGEPLPKDPPAEDDIPF